MHLAFRPERGGNSWVLREHETLHTVLMGDCHVRLPCIIVADTLQDLRVSCHVTVIHPSARINRHDKSGED